VGAGVGAGVGATVGFGVGTGVGEGVGTGVGAVMTTASGFTEVRMTVCSPTPLPLVALKRYGWTPAGSVIVREKTTPSSYVALTLASGTVPTPVIATVTELGAQFALLAYRTRKVTDVDVVPDPGLASPPESVTACDFPLQLAA
jgi:hypothetical protein